MNVVVGFVFQFCCLCSIKLIYLLLDDGFWNRFSRLGENCFLLIYLFVAVIAKFVWVDFLFFFQATQFLSIILIYFILIFSTSVK
jgi:hypothetical protein